MQRSLVLIGLGVALAACPMAPAPSPVPVQGSQDDVSAFAGDWTGRYWCKATGRHGLIRFTLPERTDTGYGEVEITFSPSLYLSQEAASADYPKADVEELRPQVPVIIGITVVRIEHDRVRGTMAPYWDPDCDCRAQTVFEGKLGLQQITGNFSIRRERAEQQVLHGQWRVEREQ